LENGQWVDVTGTAASSIDPSDMYVFQKIERISGLQKKANETIYAKLYHDYDNIRVNVAIPLYRMAYSKYIHAGLGPTRTPTTSDEITINNFYNNIVEFMNLLESYEANWGFYTNRI